MSVVNVADFECSAFAVQTAGAQCGKLTFVRKFGDGVALIHKLRQLAGTEEFLDCRRYGTYVDKRLRRSLARLLNCHTFANYTFQTGNTDTELVLQQFAHGTNATVTQVVDVV